MTPFEHDMLLSDLHMKYQEAKSKYIRTLAEYSKCKPKQGEKPNDWMKRAIAKMPADSPFAFTRDTIASQARIMRTLSPQIKKLQDGYTGWNRFFMVPGGHIHKSLDCQTCNHNWFKPTQFVWLPALSGKDEAKAVKDHGAILCTVCWPSAPVEYTQGVEEDLCPGVGTTDWEKTDKLPRFGFVSNNGGNCKHCGQWVAPKSDNNRVMRKHKPSA